MSDIHIVPAFDVLIDDDEGLLRIGSLRQTEKEIVFVPAGGVSISAEALHEVGAQMTEFEDLMVDFDSEMSAKH